MHNKTHLSCSTGKNKGTCSNKLTIKREDLEARVLHALNANLMDEGLVEAFFQEFTKRMNELRRKQNAARSGLIKEQGKLTLRKDKIV